MRINLKRNVITEYLYKNGIVKLPLNIKLQQMLETVDIFVAEPRCTKSSVGGGRQSVTVTLK